MKQHKINTSRHGLIYTLLLFIILFNALYFFQPNKYISYSQLTIANAFILFILFILLHMWIFIPFRRIVKFIYDYSAGANISTEKDGLSNYLFPHLMLKKIIDRFIENEKQQEELMQQLQHSNDILERNNKIMDSFIQITNDILSSGDIETVLQSILDKAIEIIPYAQKGSILLYNGKAFQFKAVKGYDFEILKDFKFKLEEAYQYGSEDFFEPIIINDVEAYNSSKLNKDKYDVLKEGRGFELKSAISCAIVVDNELYGLLNIDNMDSTDAFREEDKPLIKHLSVQIGIALKNASLLEKIIYLSRHDSLTDLYNRNYFEKLLHKVLEQALENGNIFSVAVMDIDDLKMVNDTYGHEAGDLLIKNFVGTVSGHLGSDDIFARMGGDEFTIVFPGKSKEQVEKVIEGINESFSDNPFTYCGREILSISYCCGVTTYPADSQNLDALLRIADRFMYDYKKKKKAAN